MTSSARALDVLAANGEGFPAPGLGEFYPKVVASFSVAGIHFEITRITIILWIATLAMAAFLYATARNPQIVPGRMQFIGETGYSLVRDGIARDVVGPKGLAFAPFLASLFFFILANNMMSIIPFAQISPMSKFAFPLVLALICWVIYIWIGIREQGVWHYFRDILFLPGVPKFMYVLVTPIEILQNFIVRPFTLAVRLFANMFAGHMLLLVFTLGGFAMLNANAWFLPFSIVSWVMTIALTFLEFLVICLQAYVFTVLTASYVQGALAEEH